MLWICSGKYLLTLVFFINGIGLFYCQDAHNFAILCDQCHFVALTQTIRRRFWCRQGDRNGPKQTFIIPTLQAHVINHTLPISFIHKAIKRGKTTDTQHDQITTLA